MSNLPHADNVEKLRSDFRHFDKSGNFGGELTVMEIKAHLLRRITELESALRRTAEFETQSVQPTSSPKASDPRIEAPQEGRNDHSQ